MTKLPEQAVGFGSPIVLAIFENELSRIMKAKLTAQNIRRLRSRKGRGVFTQRSTLQFRMCTLHQQHFIFP